MFTLNCKGRLLVLDQTIVMGIINATPDSFYEGSRVMNTDDILLKAGKMIDEGATILDVGGLSTRPGSDEISVDEEIERVVPAIEAIHNRYPNIIISIDTYRAAVVNEAIAAGASIVNDISGGTLDETMFDTVANWKVPYICMHMRGTPKTMQKQTTYADVTMEVLDYFIQKIEACRRAGINDVIIDPGFGFAKTIEQNFKLLKELSIFKMLQKPLLLGVSRKSSIAKTLGITNNEALNGTTILNTIGLLNGAHILRVHDVKEATEAIKLTAAVIKLD